MKRHTLCSSNREDSKQAGRSVWNQFAAEEHQVAYWSKIKTPKTPEVLGIMSEEVMMKGYHDPVQAGQLGLYHRPGSM